MSDDELNALKKPESDPTPLCPLRFAGSADRRCQQKRCAWWMMAADSMLAGSCCLKRIAEAQDYQAEWRQDHWNQSGA